MSIRKTTFRLPRQLALLAACALSILVFAADLRAAEIVIADGTKVEVNAGNKVRISKAGASASSKASGETVEGTVKFVLGDAKEIIVETRKAGRTRDVRVRWSDITEIEVDGVASSAKSTRSSTATAAKGGAKGDAKSSDTATADEGQKKTVFIMPWEGTVGIGARHDEILKIAAEADKLGPGQIIVLQVISPGGLVIEGDKIDETLMELKKRHRVIAWIKEAISAAAFTSLHCEEIYFMRVGTIGAITMFSGTKSIEGAELEAWVKKVGDVTEESGRSRWIGEAMVTNAPLLSYDRDEDGNVTWYNTLEGEYDLSNADENLTLNADVALHCKFSDGTADTPEQLLALLHLDDSTAEISPIGFKIHENWQKTLNACLDAKIKLIRDVMNPAGSEDVAQIGSRIKAINELIAWWDRCPPCLQYESPPVPPKEELEKEVKNLRKTLADIQRRRRG
jgi:hypothetical protein